MKGISQDFFSIFLIILSLSIFSFLILNFITSETGRIKRVVEERFITESGVSSILSLYFSRLNYFEKYYLEGVIDAILQNSIIKKHKKSVFYGTGAGSLNTTEIIEPLLKRYFGDRWYLEIILGKRKESFGRKPTGKNVFVVEVTIPVPEEKIGKIILYTY